eukprot:36235-Chlamydomonas_euryale.AAC.1
MQTYAAVKRAAMIPRPLLSGGSAECAQADARASAACVACTRAPLIPPHTFPTLSPTRNTRKTQSYVQHTCASGHPASTPT